MQSMFAERTFDDPQPDTSPIGMSDKVLASLRNVRSGMEASSAIVWYRGKPYQMTIEPSVIELLEA